MMIREASATAREAETVQAASQTEAKAVEAKTGAGREEDVMRKREPETENLAETAKEIETGTVAATETGSTR